MNNQLLLIIIIIIVIFFIYNSTTKSVKQQSSSISDTFIPHIDIAGFGDARATGLSDRGFVGFGDRGPGLSDMGLADFGDTTHLSVDGLAGNDAFQWFRDYGNDMVTLNNDNYVDKIVGTNSNNSSALLAQNKQIGDLWNPAFNGSGFGADGFGADLRDFGGAGFGDGHRIVVGVDDLVGDKGS